MGTEGKAARAADFLAPKPCHRSMNEPCRTGIEDHGREPLPADPTADGGQQPGIALAQTAASPQQPISEPDDPQQGIADHRTDGMVGQRGWIPEKRQEQPQQG